MPNGQLSIVDLVTHAGPVVQGVFVLLVLASVWCWAIIMRAMFNVWRLQRGLAQAKRGGNGRILASLKDAASIERAHDMGPESTSELRMRMAAAMRRRGQEVVEAGQAGLTNLAVISSVAPFVGLFGTVWGIMTSFIGIAAAKDTSLAVVAPGIAEALAATAIGLAAAIPAAFAYNRLADAFNRVSRRIGRLADDHAAVLVDRRAGGES